MAHAYTPGLAVYEHTRIKVRRLLPIRGEVLVGKGEKVEPGTVVAQAFLPGPVTPVNVAQKLGATAEEVPQVMCMKRGDKVDAGQVLAQTKGLFGLFRSEVTAPVSGTVESISSRTGQVMLRQAPHPLKLDAYIGGEVVEIIPRNGAEIAASGSMIQGIFGIGGERRGNILVACEKPDGVLTKGDITERVKGAVLVAGAFADKEAYLEAARAGASALVVGGFDDYDLREILGYDLGVAITGQENVSTTLIVTEGFGRIPMAEATFELLKKLEGKLASVNGATQIRAGVMRPEILVPFPAGGGDSADERKSLETDRMETGSSVRIIRKPFFGRTAKVKALPPEPVVIETGAKVRVVEVEFADGRKATVPRANVELMKAQVNQGGGSQAGRLPM